MIRQVAELVGYFALLLGGAAALGFWFAQRRIGRPVKCLQAGTVVRVRSGSQVYRSRFVERSPEGWVFSAPLSRDRHIPLTPGETLVVETSTKQGLLLFQTKVLQRAMNPHTFTVQAPENLRPMNRRRDERIEGFAWSEAWLGSTAGVLLDVSTSGARVSADRRLEPGTEVCVRLGYHPQPVEALVVGCDTQGRDSVVRVRFLEIVPLPAG